MLKVNWSGVSHIAAKVFTVVLGAVLDVEKLAPLLGGPAGDVKQHAALELALGSLRSMEDLAATAAAKDPAVHDAIRGVIAAQVTLLNAIEQAHLGAQRDDAAGVI